MRKICGFISFCVCRKYHPGLCSSFIHTVVSNDSDSGQWRPWSDCADAQADLGLRCPHMPKDTFSQGASLMTCVRPKNYLIYTCMQIAYTCRTIRLLMCLHVSTQSQKRRCILLVQFIKTVQANREVRSARMSSCFCMALLTLHMPAPVAESDARPTGQEVAISIPAGSGSILPWIVIMKYFLRPFSPYCWFKKGSCQFLAKECAQAG